MKQLTVLILLIVPVMAWAQEPAKWQGKFEQLGTTLPTPNEYRTGSGAPGPKYWQQKADYVINVELNDDNQSITGSETITYHNNSPETLKYLWLQLDQNVLAEIMISMADIKSNPSKMLQAMHCLIPLIKP